jgi:D-ribulokinase
MAAMSVAEETITPDPACRALHDRRFAAYEKLQALFRELRQP